MHTTDKPDNQRLDKIEIYSELSCPELAEGSAFRFPTVIRHLKAAAAPAIMIVI